MNSSMLGLAAIAMATGAAAGPITFDNDAVGVPPAGWACGVTGRGSPRWAVANEPGASGKVLMQSGSGTFPWCIRSGSAVTDGFVEVRFKPISGKEDQAGGVVWRWKDGDNYYVARANALENNVSLYYTERGSRKTLQYVDAPVERNRWHLLRVEFMGDRIALALDGKRYVEMTDAHITGSGGVGVWTKADSVTAFKDFSFGAAPR